MRDAVPGAHLGVTIMPEYVQCEGVEPVLDRLEQLGVTSITTMPSVAGEVPEGQGAREPPIDGGAGGVRVLDRPLWGKQALYMETAPSFAPDRHRYAGLAYQPPEPTALTDHEGPVVARFIDAAKARGMSVYLQVMAAIPPCLRVQFGGPHDDDRPMLPNGGTVPGRVDNNASLASGDVRNYLEVMLADLLSAYPQVDGIRFDWPEYPPYHALSLLTDYNPQVRPFAEAADIDFDGLRERMLGLGKRLSETWPLFDGRPGFQATLDRAFKIEPAIAEHLALRTYLVADYARHLRQCVSAAGDGRHKVFLQGFPPPWNRLSGFDVGRMRKHADLVGIKFYTMHWPMMLRNHVENLAQASGRDRDELAEAVKSLFAPGYLEGSGLETLVYPEPDAPHNVDDELIRTKYAAAGSASAGLIAITHGYGPMADVVARFGAAWRASGGRVEINRYGYLSDEKLIAIADHRRRLEADLA